MSVGSKRSSCSILYTPTRGSGLLLDDAGKPVPFQLIENSTKLAIRTDLPADNKRTWRWFAGAKNSAANPPGITVQANADGIEIANELIAFRVPTAKAI